MHRAVVHLAVPPGGDTDPTFLKWGFGILGVFVVLSVLASWETRRQRRKIPLDQLVEELGRKIRTGVPNVRGHVRIDPSEFPGISDADAERIAGEQGFLRQTHGTKGLWLFYREGTRPGSSSEADVLGGPPVEVLRDSEAARRTAAWIRERDGIDVLDGTTVEEAENGMRKARSKADRNFVGAFFCVLAGVPIVSALVGAWVNSGPPGMGGIDDVVFVIVAHTLGVLLPVGSVRMFKKSRRARREGREHYGPVLAAYGEVVAARENERRTGK
ncbi:hypothetical protein ACFV1B_25280 [Streptomyces sp. NPDC059637]|uniref:hypothetical protein n=1 Tax=Streptomyces sp. NPDC059637 TaxID=3347752 RepID=UPI0036871370